VEGNTRFYIPTNHGQKQSGKLMIFGVLITDFWGSKTLAGGSCKARAGKRVHPIKAHKSSNQLKVNIACQILD
jgi:hypothetical protein